MDILSSSKLLRSRYSECVPLFHPETLAATTAARTKTERGSTIYRDVNSHALKRGDIAFLSSVQTPSEVYLALACVARYRDTTMLSECERMLVFVPYDIPRDEIFVEMPILAFKEGKDPTRGEGLQLMVLNEYTLLCFRTKDGLPPRKGLFITFRTTKAQELFQNAVDQLIRYHDKESLFHNKSPPVKSLNRMGPTREEYIRAGTPTSGAIIPRGSVYTTMQEREWPKEEKREEKEKKEGKKEMEEDRGAMSLINNLLRDRERRREAYMASIGKPTHPQPYLTGLTPSTSTKTTSFLKREDNNIEFSEWAQQHQKLNPTAWKMLAGAAESQMMSECQTAKDKDGVIQQSHGFPNSDAVFSPYNNVPSLQAREDLLLEIRAAMEAVDKMNEAQGRGGVSLLGSAREFIRQHQEELWRLEQGENKLHPSPPPLFDFKHMDTRSPSAPTVLLQKQKEQEEEEKRRPTVSEVSKESLRPSISPSALQAFENIIPKPEQQQQQQTVIETIGTVKDIVTTTPIISSESLSLDRHPVESVVSMQGPQVKFQEELQVARETESRILSTLHKAPPKIMGNKRMFGTNPKVSTSLQPAPITPVVKGVENGNGDRNGNTTSSFTVDGAIASSVQPGTNNKDASDVTSAEPIPPVVEEEKKKKEEEEEIPRCGEGWKTVRDPASGKHYFVHTLTKRTTWNISDTFKPNSSNEEQKQEEKDTVKEKSKCGTGWRAVLDPGTGRTYYVHKITKSTTWKVEDTFEEKKNTSNGDNKTTEKQKPIKTSSSSSSVWGERQDPSTGKVYYYNKKTKQTTWKRSETDLDTA
ncbi:uncharacterized protein TM35_000132540 [Trypanosoma theileri]|uniref:WW domain-containing protein n=1 Tax=Trypanosoma theileri TaxID=67003 RepID=A0A1X0NYL6_9TRYP|nr:uncharacterized protein TM35_000132540 [Trypanosoma theileri]ORC89250.1 hypothetical protein TM35_000132540 [Trypanosoma theileri]